jgi:NAD(P)H-dependent flavin oxidoreductase YrpB (nitropropane dioxygenase family)
MQTELVKMFGLGFPLCGFSHCRDVVIALSKAGGLGVLGTARYSPEQFDIELTEIDEALKGRPYGVTIIFPKPKANDDGHNDPAELAAKIPEEYWNYVRGLAERFGVPLHEDSKNVQATDGAVNAYPLTREHALRILEVVKRHPVSLVSSAIGAPPKDAVDELHAMGIKVSGQVGNPKHVKHHVAAGVDLIVATGTEAGGHTGDIATMVLTPQVVRAAAPLPVLAAGGIGMGRQLLAALALGAEGAWTGSIWLATLESDLPQELKHKLVEAKVSDTIRNRSLSGRPARQLRTPWVEAWEEPGAPVPLPAPLQGVLVKDAQVGMLRSGQEEVMGTPAGQVIGEIGGIRSVKEIMLEMMSDFGESAERVDKAVSDIG